MTLNYYSLVVCENVVKGIPATDSADRNNIAGPELEDAIYHALELLGNTARQLFMDELARTRIFESNKKYSIKDINEILEKTLGRDGASLVVNKIRKHCQM